MVFKTRSHKQSRNINGHGKGESLQDCLQQLGPMKKGY